MTLIPYDISNKDHLFHIPDLSSAAALDSFNHIFDMLSQTSVWDLGDHPNILHFYGHTPTKYILTEAMSLGRLDLWLEKKSRFKKANSLGDDSGFDHVSSPTTATGENIVKLAPLQRMDIAYAIASGLAYLSSVGVIIGDVASRNVLLCDNNEKLKVKITNLHIGVFLPSLQMYYTNLEGDTVFRWLA
eukprot:UC4_evm2s1404